jgi:hypothetical protein
MALNRGQLISEAIYMAGNRDDLAAHAIVWFNWALHRIDRVCDMKGLEVRAEASTVINQKEYALPSDCKYIESIRLIDGANSRYLTAVDSREFDQKIPYPEQFGKGRSNFYVEWESIFELYRIPNAVWTMLMRYWKWQDEIDADGTSPEIAHCDDIIVQALVAEIWKNTEELDKEKAAHAKLLSMLYAHKGVEKMHPDFEPKAKAFRSGAEGAIIGERHKNPFDKG